MQVNGDVLKKPGSFWITIATAVVAGVITFSQLESRVDAVENKQVTFERSIIRLEEKIDTILNSQQELLIEQAGTRKDIEYIKSAIIVVAE